MPRPTERSGLSRRGSPLRGRPRSHNVDIKLVRATKQFIKLSQGQEHPNVLVGLHFFEQTEGCGLSANRIVLGREVMHRTFKSFIYGTNLYNPERDLLRKLDVLMTLHFGLENPLRTTYPEFSSQVCLAYHTIACREYFARSSPHLEQIIDD
ncbi:hypothetical protein K470DRAFT_223280 [Piedraia hortae CBS 480.64]|uniref:Uncharacterized protein n=1 Tax=Piedraia hortae CBS 480.64 TaxID=1314780 RepID=A0A6A7BQC8_9PEZI|nr:hypothetical protein K470DRAFT_223280 [Piedraia hortae CBS 480.64]